jgi:hypothetical protein
MNRIDSWEKLERNIGSGITVIQVKRKTPYERILSIGKEIKIKDTLQKEKPLTEAQKLRKKKIRKDINKYFKLNKK